jgi:hypothetical protein
LLPKNKPSFLGSKPNTYDYRRTQRKNDVVCKAQLVALPQLTITEQTAPVISLQMAPLKNMFLVSYQ